MKIKDTEIKIVKGDITELEAEALVNAANNKLLMGGGVAGAIKRKGGEAIEKEAVKKGPIKIGEAVFTGAGKLKAKYIIHAATMGMPACRQAGMPVRQAGMPVRQAGIFQTDEIKIRNSCKASLDLAEELNVKSIVFPALGCGVGGFPLLASAKIMAQEVLRHIREKEKVNLKEIIFCLYDQEAFEIFNKGVLSYLKYVTHKLSIGPFTTVDAIIEVKGGIVVIERSNSPFGWALPGGFVDYNESLEDAVRREMKEETGLDLENLRQFHTYSKPGRDPRFHTICTVFLATSKGEPKAGDDAKGVKVVNLSEAHKLVFAFDHDKIIADYIAFKKGENPF